MVPNKQIEPQPFLKLIDMPADGSVSNTQFFGGKTKAFEPAGSVKRSQ
jgi:hypothetical protein